MRSSSNSKAPYELDGTSFQEKYEPERKDVSALLGRAAPRCGCSRAVSGRNSNRVLSTCTGMLRSGIIHARYRRLHVWTAVVRYKVGYVGWVFSFGWAHNHECVFTWRDICRLRVSPRGKSSLRFGSHDNQHSSSSSIIAATCCCRSCCYQHLSPTHPVSAVLILPQVLWSQTTPCLP